jgi:hypothetical protein
VVINKKEKRSDVSTAYPKSKCQAQLRENADTCSPNKVISQPSVTVQTPSLLEFS